MEKPIRILQIAMSSNPGGVENFVINVYRNINREKIQFDFLLDHNATKIPYEEEIIKLGGHIYREYYRRKEIFTKGRKSVKQFLKEHPEIQGVHMHANTINPMFKALEVAKKIGLPIRILHSHNSGYMTRIKLKDRIYEKYERLRLKKITTNLLACSEEAGKWMFKNNDFKIINNGIDIEKYRYDENKRKEIRKEMKIDENQYVIGHIGRMNYQKNPIFLIEVFYELYKIDKNVKLLYIGNGNMKNQIKEKIKQYEIEENVILTGAVNNPEEYLQAMDCFVLPSRFEGLGIVLLEAQANGLQCYTTNKVPKNVNATGLVEYIDINDNPQKWSEKILNKKHIKRKTEVKESLTKNGYDIKDTAKKLEEIYLKGNK